MKIDKSAKIGIVLGTPFLAGFLLGLLVGGCGKQKPQEEQFETFEQSQPEQKKDGAYEVSEVEVAGDRPNAYEVIYYTRRMPYHTLFADSQESHLEMAKSKGLREAPTTRIEVENTPGLVKIASNDYYVLFNLTHSVPYLTPGAAKELNTIAKAFRDSLYNHDLVDYQLVVTSVLRTKQDVANLRKSGNPNAVENSSHSYGTTFDIAYTRYYRKEETDEFMQPYELTKVLGEVLRDQKAAGNCLVKYERKEHCFHITSCR